MRGFFLSVAYVLGISLTYALLGVVAASTGRLFGSFVQSTWVAGFVIVVFLALSLSMFGFYELPMFGGLSERYQGRVGAGLVGVFVMGLIAGLVASPCVGPVIVGLLVYISTTGNIVLGFLMLFVMGWGMGLLLIVLGTFSGAISLLPRSGEWMVLVKHVFGLLMLSGAFYYLKGLVPWPIFLGALGVTLCVLGVLAGRFDALTPKKGAVTRIRKTFALLCVVLGACVIVSIFLPRLGISLFAPAQEAARPDAMGKKGIRWLSSEQEGLAKARAEARPVMIDFWANWCAVCVHLDETTYADPQVVREAQRFVTVKIDCTDSSSPAVKELLARYGVVGLPTIVFIDSKGQWQREKTVNKYISAAELLAIMRGVQ
jgi:thiol:disulfide interchange protein DsbD